MQQIPSLKINNVFMLVARICSKHFDPQCFTKTPQQQMLNYSPRHGKKLHPGAIPTLHLPQSALSRSALQNECNPLTESTKSIQTSIVPEIDAVVSLETLQSPVSRKIPFTVNECHQITSSNTVSLAVNNEVLPLSQM